MEFRYSADKIRYKTMNNLELRETFALEELFSDGQVNLVYSDIDRGIIGAAIPLSEDLVLDGVKEIVSDFFLQRRELGVINIGGLGQIETASDVFQMHNRDSLYIARGEEKVVFRSVDSSNPAKFYLVSYPAHANHKTKLIKKSEAIHLSLGAQETANKRVIYQSIHPSLVKTCQLVMGFTTLDSGSVWNTFPPHTHQRRSEFYMYFDMPETSRVFHFMGEEDNMKPIVVANEEVVLSPSWSMHCGVGSTAYSFIWSMGGENQQFDDMDHIDLSKLR